MINHIRWNIVEILNIIAEVFIIGLYLEKLMPRKYEKSKIYPLVFFGLTVILYISILFEFAPTFNVLLTFLSLFAISMFLYEGAITKKIFFSLLFLVTVFISEFLFIGCMTTLKITTPEELSKPSMVRLIGMVGVKIIYFWIIMFLCRLINKKMKEIPMNQWVTIVSMPIVSAVVLYALSVSFLVSNGTVAQWLYILAVIGITFMNIVIFDFFEGYHKQLRLSVLEQVIEHENTNYKQLETAYSDMRKLKHDVNNQITVISDLVSKNDKESASKLIKNLSERLEDINVICYTGEPIIDSIINIKLRDAHKLGIKISKNINVRKFSLDCFELCRVLGNALDNSIEGCERYQGENKYIHISMQQIDDKIAIEISNSSDVVDPKNLQTQKKNKAAHNIGMSSIKTSVEKLNGLSHHDYKDNVFFLRIIVTNKL